MSATAARSVEARVRHFVYGFLGLVLVSGLAALEYWPLTGFRLYHELRTPTHPSWELVVVDGAGTEHAASLYDLPIAYRNTERQLGRRADVDPARAAAVCAAWAAPFGERNPGAEELRIYRSRIVARSGESVSRQLVYTCPVGA
ncbi:MAG: hypothetical protein ACT4OX_01400 [Actinomycetota bacterium]